MGRVSDAARYLVPSGPFSLSLFSCSHFEFLSNSTRFQLLTWWKLQHPQPALDLTFFAPYLRVLSACCIIPSQGKRQDREPGQAHLHRDFKYIIPPSFNAWTSHAAPHPNWMRTAGLHQFKSSPGAFWASLTVSGDDNLVFFQMVGAVSVFILWAGSAAPLNERLKRFL